MECMKQVKKKPVKRSAPGKRRTATTKKRTTVILSPELEARVKRRARAEGVDMADIIRRALEKEVAAPGGMEEFFALMHNPPPDSERRPGAPTDGSINHDAYIWDEDT